MTRLSRRRPGVPFLVTLLVAMIAALLAGIAVAPSAEAATTYSRTFSQTSTKYFSTLNRCVTVTVSGTATFQITDRTSYWGVYTARKILNPKVTVYSYNRCTPYPLTSTNLSKISVQQVWPDKVCKGGVEISVGLPWSIAATPTVACGTVTAARRSSSYGTGASFVQNNSSTTVTFENHYYDPIAWSQDYYRSQPVKRYSNCYAAQVNLTLYVGNVSDSWSPTFGPCVKP